MKNGQDTVTRFTAFPVLKSFLAVKNHTSGLLKYEFYIKVDEKAHKVSMLLCRIIL